jgi:multidrug transporter EmrE-like cation transporter
MAYLFLTLAFTLNAVANVLLKIGATRGLSLSGPFFSLIAANWQLIVGLTLFGLNVVFYMLALRTLPISVAYPVMVLMGFILINGYALTMLNESLVPLQLLGYALMVVGLLLVVFAR